MIFNKDDEEPSEPVFSAFEAIVFSGACCAIVLLIVAIGWTFGNWLPGK